MNFPIKVILGVLIISTTFILTYRAINLEPTKGLPINAQVKATLDNSGCLLCHSNRATLPSYSKWPLIGSKIKKDSYKAKAKIDIEMIWLKYISGEVPDSLSSSKIISVLESHTMPPFSFTILRPGSAINSKERELLKKWLTPDQE